MKKPFAKIFTVFFIIILGLGTFSCGKQPAATDTPLPVPATQTPLPTETNTPIPTLLPGMTCAAGLPRPTLTMDQFIGINSFNDVPDDVNAVAGILREYHPWAWDQVEPGIMKWNPSYAGGELPWNFDAWYGSLAALVPPVLVSPVLMDNIGGNTYKPVASGMQANDPAAYTAHGEYMYQFAARYGSVTVADGNLTLASDQPRLSGLNLVHYVEDWNEPDRSWASTLSNFAPDEYAAMASADYDGHCGTLGEAVGLRNADPSIRLVMGGVADGVDKYYFFLNGVRFWSDAHRGGSLPFDAINIHHYSTSGATGKSPEEDNLVEQLQRVTRWRDSFAPDKEVWYSEFGWDTHPDSPYAARAIGPYSIEQVQGQWIVRAYLLAKAAGVDRAFQFMVRDTESTNRSAFMSSGLTKGKPDYIRKPSWYYVYTLKNRLAGTTFTGVISPDGSPVMVYLFENVGVGRKVYVLWSPTTDGTVVPGYSLKLDGSPASASLVNLAEGSTDGIETVLTISNGAVHVDVSESPVFVAVEQ